MISDLRVRKNGEGSGRGLISGSFPVFAGRWERGQLQKFIV
jgi:hypothetical protein